MHTGGRALRYPRYIIDHTRQEQPARSRCSRNTSSSSSSSSAAAACACHLRRCHRSRRAAPVTCERKWLTLYCVDCKRAAQAVTFPASSLSFVQPLHTARFVHCPASGHACCSLLYFQDSTGEWRGRTQELSGGGLEAAISSRETAQELGVCPLLATSTLSLSPKLVALTQLPTVFNLGTGPNTRIISCCAFRPLAGCMPCPQSQRPNCSATLRPWGPCLSCRRGWSAPAAPPPLPPVLPLAWANLNLGGSKPTMLKSISKVRGRSCLLLARVCLRQPLLTPGR